MTQRIIYQTDEGGVGIIIPSGQLPIDEVARKDVPAGTPYKIINTVDVPTDRTFRAAWEADMSDSHGEGVGAHAWFIEQYQAEIEVLNAEAFPDIEIGQDVMEYATALNQWQENKNLRIAQLNAQIAVQQAEMQA